MELYLFMMRLSNLLLRNMQNHVEIADDVHLLGEHENNQFVIYYSVSAKLMKKCSFKGKQIIKMEECGMDADDWKQILLLSSFWEV